MTVGIIIFAVFFTAIAVLLLMPVTIEAVYENNELSKDKSACVKYGFIRYSVYPKKPPKKAKDKKNAEEEQKVNEGKEEHFSFDKKKKDIEKYIRIFNSVKKDAEKLLSYAAKRAAVFDKIEIKSEFGFEDAMQTGIFTGIYNGFVYSVIGVIHHTSKLKDMEVNLQPVFGEKCFYNHFSCILHIKTVHIIIIAFSVLRILRKAKKEGRK